MNIKIITSRYSCGHEHLVSCINDIPCPLCGGIVRLRNPGFTETLWHCTSCDRFLRIGPNKIRQGFWVKLPKPFVLLDECAELRTKREESRLRILAVNNALKRGIKYSIAAEKVFRQGKGGA